MCCEEDALCCERICTSTSVRVLHTLQGFGLKRQGGNHLVQLPLCFPAFLVDMPTRGLATIVGLFAATDDS